MPPKGRGTAGSRPGDATGREKERLEKEVRPAIEEAATRVALTNAPPVVEHPDAVVDYTDGGAPSAEMASAGVRMLSMDEAIGDGQTGHTPDDVPISALSDAEIAALPDGTVDVRPETIERTEEPQSAARVPSARPVQHVTVETPDVQPAFKIMRVNTDLPDVTIGKDKHFTFRENTRYKVPLFVYEHLDEKGYVYH